MSSKKSAKEVYRDSEFYMSHYQKDALTEKGYADVVVSQSFPLTLVSQVFVDGRRILVCPRSAESYLRPHQRRSHRRTQKTSADVGQEEEEIHQGRWRWCRQCQTCKDRERDTAACDISQWPFRQMEGTEPC